MILCAEKSQETIELMELDNGSIHVAQYLTKMPPKEVLERKLLQAIANAKEQLEQRDSTVRRTGRDAIAVKNEKSLSESSIAKG